MQRHDGGRAWRAPTTQDFLRQLRWRRENGWEVCAILSVPGRRADILVRSPDDERAWRVLWTYPEEGLRAMRQAALVRAEDVTEVPGLDLAEFLRREGRAERFGEFPDVWLLEP